jgi:ElaB protein
MTESKLAEEIKHLKSESKNINKRAREHYLEQVSDFSEKIKQIGDNASTKAKQVIDKVGEYVTENPQKSALIGIGIGLGLGLLLGLLIQKNNKEE